MKDSATAIRSAFFTRITALGYAAYDTPPETTTAPYVYLYNQSSYQDGNQSEFGQVASISIDVVTEFQKDYGGGKVADTMVDVILQDVLKFAPAQLTVSGFDCISVTLDGVNSMHLTSATTTQHIRTIKLKLILYQI